MPDVFPSELLQFLQYMNIIDKFIFKINYKLEQSFHHKSHLSASYLKSFDTLNLLIRDRLETYRKYTNFFIQIL